MLHALQNHHLGYNKTLRIPPTCSCSLEIVSHCPHKAPPHLSPSCVVSPLQYHGKFLTPRLPFRVFRDPPTEVPTAVGMHPVTINVPETYILRHSFLSGWISVPALYLSLLPSVIVWLVGLITPFVRISVGNFSDCDLLLPYLPSHVPGFPLWFSPYAPLPPIFPLYIPCCLWGADVGAPPQALSICETENKM